MYKYYFFIPSVENKNAMSNDNHTLYALLLLGRQRSQPSIFYDPGKQTSFTSSSINGFIYTCRFHSWPGIFRCPQLGCGKFILLGPYRLGRSHSLYKHIWLSELSWQSGRKFKSCLVEGFFLSLSSIHVSIIRYKDLVKFFTKNISISCGKKY